MIPLEYCDIYTDLSETFKIEDIPDDLLVKLFHNIDNKLLRIGGSNFIILHRVFDGKIFKIEITEDNEDEIEEMLS